MLISNISVDKNAQLFETLRRNNSSVTAPGAYILLGFDYVWSFETHIIDNHRVTAPSDLIVFGEDITNSFETTQKTITMSLHQVPIFSQDLIH